MRNRNEFFDFLKNLGRRLYIEEPVSLIQKQDGYLCEQMTQFFIPLWKALEFSSGGSEAVTA
jgi:hypothetical protein